MSVDHNTTDQGHERSPHLSEYNTGGKATLLFETMHLVVRLRGGPREVTMSDQPYQERLRYGDSAYRSVFTEIPTSRHRGQGEHIVW